MAIDESAPLLISRPIGHYSAVPLAASDAIVPPAGKVDDENDDTSPPPPLNPQERRASLIKWVCFWMAIAAAIGYLVVESVRRGGGEFEWRSSLSKALGGGLSGAAAMIIQVLSLMPLRTCMNYQYRNGRGFVEVIGLLYAENGVRRFYAGLAPALFQGPLARFGDTAANVGILALLSSNPFLSQLPSPLKTVFASIAAALFRMILVPIDTLKTTLQCEGSRALPILRDRIRAYGIGTLWYGAFATAAASFVGSFPWFATYNYLGEVLPPSTNLLTKLLRQAVIGFSASVVSDTISNSLRVVKTYRQVNRVKISYTAAARRIIASEGYTGLFGRGLKVRLLANGLQGLLFSVLWSFFQDLLAGEVKT